MKKNEKLSPILNKRDPDKTLFILLTPQIFKNNPRSRLYNYVFNEYKNNPDTLKHDLIHKNLTIDGCKEISKRMGWITWEDLKSINNECCKWMDKI